MTATGAGTKQPTPARRPGRIIERPRLIQQLDAAESPVILIVGPAGYGKTTLARQWARTLTGVIWVSCTPAHRDVVTFAEDVAAGIDALGGNASRFIGEYMRARSNPQRAAREIGQVLAKKLNEAPVQWLVIDDYQELAESPEVQEMTRIVVEAATARTLIASRMRPSWVGARHILYGEITEVGAPDLALTPSEASIIVGGRNDLQPLIAKAKGWPAVIALAAALERPEALNPLPGMLHDYVGEELFKAASPAVRDQLLSLALLPDLSPSTLEMRFGPEATAVIEEARRLGFLPSEPAPDHLHPLLRDFLFTKLAADASAAPRIRQAVDIAVERRAWDQALNLVLQFKLADIAEGVFEEAFRPLSRTGRLGTLSWFASESRDLEGFPPAVVDVVNADVALRDGDVVLACTLAKRGADRLQSGNALRSRAHQIQGRAHFFRCEFEESERAYACALESAGDEPDETESIFGLATTKALAELGDTGATMELLAKRRELSPLHLVRHATAVMTVERFETGLRDPPIDEACHYLDRVENPLIRSAFTYVAAYTLVQRAEYRRAEPLLSLLRDDIARYALEFAQPFADWTEALLSLGLRRPGDADRYLSRVDAVAAKSPQSEHALNARLLRARLLLQTGDAPNAAVILRRPHTSSTFPSWTGELYAMRAVTETCLGNYDEARSHANNALDVTECREVHVLAATAEAIRDAVLSQQPPRELFSLAEDTCVWDPVLMALRISRPLLSVAAIDMTLRPALERLLQLGEDVALARQARLRPKATRAPAEVLSARELEVLGLVSQGFRNREIATALFVAESTVKVHVRHILEKLGVRTRAEAVAHFERSR